MKDNKKTIILNIFLILVIISIIGVVYYFLVIYSDNAIPHDKNKTYTYEIKDNKLHLKSEEGIEQTYECKENCAIYKSAAGLEYYKDGVILLKDGEVIFLYDLFKGKKVSEDYNRVDFITDNNEKTVLFKVNTVTGKQGVVDLNGNVQIPSKYSEIGKGLDEVFTNYSYEKNYITAKLDSKWGLITLDKGKKVIDFKYDDMALSPYNKLAVLESKKWHLIDDTDKKILNQGYDSMQILENHLVVNEASQAFILNSSGKEISNKLNIFYKVDPWATITPAGLKGYIDQDILYLKVDIPVDTNAGTYKTDIYYYDKDSKEILRNE